MEPGESLSVSDNTGLILCADGTPVFKSSKCSLWPVYLALTSISPNKRMRLDNVIIAAFISWANKARHGCPPSSYSRKYSSSRRESIIRPKLLMAVFNLPAKAATTNTKQYNGEF